MHKNELGSRAATRLRDTEHAIDKALGEALLLGHELVAGRIAVGFSAAVGQDSLTHILDGLNRLGGARGALVLAHAGLKDAAEDMGVRWRMDGPLEPKPTGEGRSSPLRAVG
jgi:hypothetical protein